MKNLQFQRQFLIIDKKMKEICDGYIAEGYTMTDDEYRGIYEEVYKEVMNS